MEQERRQKDRRKGKRVRRQGYGAFGFKGDERRTYRERRSGEDRRKKT
ncbi:MAG: hypothetical protein ABII88_01885 [Candidatus Omnitrophota bacterium]